MGDAGKEKGYGSQMKVKELRLFWTNESKTKKHRMVNLVIQNDTLIVFDSVMGGSPITRMECYRMTSISEHAIRFYGYVPDGNGKRDYVRWDFKFKLERNAE